MNNHPEQRKTVKEDEKEGKKSKSEAKERGKIHLISMLNSMLRRFYSSEIKTKHI